jgi:hypothetical protein
MFEELRDVNLDPTVRPTSKDRLFKLALGAAAVALLAVCGYFVSRVELFPATVTLTNDMGGAVVCYDRVSNHGGNYVQSSGRIAAGANARVVVNNNCAVFDASGRYVACLQVRAGMPGSVLASSADRMVTTEACVYPE